MKSTIQEFDTHPLLRAEHLLELWKMLSQIEVRTQDEQQLYDLLNEQFIWQLGTPSDEVDSAPEPEPTKAEAKPTKPDESRVATMLQQCMAILNEQSDQLNLLSGRIVEVEARQGIQLRP